MRIADAADLVKGQIVEHDLIAGLQGSDEGLFDIAAEASACHRSVEECGGRPAACAQACGDGGSLPAPERHRDPAAFSAWSPPVAADHLSVGGGLIEEHEPVWV